jgi:hypothetical protein
VNDKLFERELLSISDPLSDRSRKSRTWLLVCSVIGFAVTQVGLVPTKITALGLEFSSGDRSSIVVLIFVVTLYFLVMFGLYALADYSAWHFRKMAADWEDDMAAYDSHRKHLIEESKLSPEQREALEEHGQLLGRMWRGGNFSGRENKLRKLAVVLGWFIGSVEFWLPPLLGVWSLWLMLRFWIDLRS